MEQDKEFSDRHSLNFETEFDRSETNFLHPNVLWEAELLNEVCVIVVVDHHFEHNVKHYSQL